VKLIRLDQDGVPAAGVEDFDNIGALRDHLSPSSASARSESSNTVSPTTADGDNKVPTARNLYILEGLNPDFVEALGSYFDIDPSFFSRHQRTALWEGRHEGGNTRNLASAEDPSQSFMMEYCEILYFEANHGAMRNPHDNRHIDMSAKPNKLSSNLDKVRNMHRKASFWSRKHSEGGGWDGKTFTFSFGLGLY
jgi:hypothetical protein